MAIWRAIHEREDIPHDWYYAQRVQCPTCGDDARVTPRRREWMWLECKSGHGISVKPIRNGVLSEFSPAVSPTPFSAASVVTYTLRQLGLTTTTQNSELRNQIMKVYGEPGRSRREEGDF